MHPWSGERRLDCLRLGLIAHDIRWEDYTRKGLAKVERREMIGYSGSMEALFGCHNCFRGRQPVGKDLHFWRRTDCRIESERSLKTKYEEGCQWSQIVEGTRPSYALGLWPSPALAKGGSCGLVNPMAAWFRPYVKSHKIGSHQPNSYTTLPDSR